ncbi:hypothetical protein PCANC_12943 [Puccinia coronata f. sp. avenae]|uniref:Uncharacterized protein n=1 Tax=Puccinia coronata f. sp. avenae TaxID=200324 RepID=A0A2N5UN74_9BASI|nr:hypothetical protein PCANC_12943 [Puccinia coronata f. sp. avenae]
MTPFNNNRTNNQFASGRAQFDGTGHTNGRTPFDGLGHTNGRTPFDGLGHTDVRTPFHGPGNTGGGTPFHGPGKAGGGTPFHGPGNTGGGTPFHGPGNTGSGTPFHGPGTTGGGTLFCGPGNTGGGTPFYGPVMHRLYGSTKNPFVASNNKFQPFLKAVVNNPASKVIIHISMDDPNAQAAKKVQEGLENETLALSYAAPEERQALAMSKERLIVNPKSNVEAGKRTKMIAKLTAHIISVYGCNAKALAVRDPDDKNRLICITRDRLYIWAQALQHNALDADFDSPPRGSKFTPEPYTIATVVELLWGRIELERDDCSKG